MYKKLNLILKINLLQQLKKDKRKFKAIKNPYNLQIRIDKYKIFYNNCRLIVIF